MISYTPKLWRVGLIKPVVTVCKNTLRNNAMTHTYHKFMKVLSTECLWHA